MRLKVGDVLCNQSPDGSMGLLEVVTANVLKPNRFELQMFFSTDCMGPFRQMYSCEWTEMEQKSLHILNEEELKLIGILIT